MQIFIVFITFFIIIFLFVLLIEGNLENKKESRTKLALPREKSLNTSIHFLPVFLSVCRMCVCARVCVYNTHMHRVTNKSSNLGKYTING